MITASVLFGPKPTSLRTSSGTFLGTSCTARADEWDQMTGALEYLNACFAVSSEVWLRSTSMPRRFISSMSAYPNSERPPQRGSYPGWMPLESAKALWQRCVSVT